MIIHNCSKGQSLHDFLKEHDFTYVYRDTITYAYREPRVGEHFLSIKENMICKLTEGQVFSTSSKDRFILQKKGNTPRDSYYKYPVPEGHKEIGIWRPEKDDIFMGQWDGRVYTGFSIGDDTMFCRILEKEEVMEEKPEVKVGDIINVIKKKDEWIDNAGGRYTWEDRHNKYLESEHPFPVIKVIAGDAKLAAGTYFSPETFEIVDHINPEYAAIPIPNGYEEIGCFKPTDGCTILCNDGSTYVFTGPGYGKARILEKLDDKPKKDYIDWPAAADRLDSYGYVHSARSKQELLTDKEIQGLIKVAWDANCLGDLPKKSWATGCPNDIGGVRWDIYYAYMQAPIPEGYEEICFGTPGKDIDIILPIGCSIDNVVGYPCVIPWNESTSRRILKKKKAKMDIPAGFSNSPEKYQKYLDAPVPEGYEEGDNRRPLQGEYYISNSDYMPLCNSYNGRDKRRIIVKKVIKEDYSFLTQFEGGNKENLDAYLALSIPKGWKEVGFQLVQEDDRFLPFVTDGQEKVRQPSTVNAWCGDGNGFKRRVLIKEEKAELPKGWGSWEKLNEYKALPCPEGWKDVGFRNAEPSEYALISKNGAGHKPLLENMGTDYPVRVLEEIIPSGYTKELYNSYMLAPVPEGWREVAFRFAKCDEYTIDVHEPHRPFLWGSSNTMNPYRVIEKVKDKGNVPDGFQNQDEYNTYCALPTPEGYITKAFRVPKAGEIYLSKGKNPQAQRAGSDFHSAHRFILAVKDVSSAPITIKNCTITNINTPEKCVTVEDSTALEPLEATSSKPSFWRRKMSRLLFAAVLGATLMTGINKLDFEAIAAFMPTINGITSDPWLIFQRLLALSFAGGGAIALARANKTERQLMDESNGSNPGDLTSRQGAHIASRQWVGLLSMAGGIVTTFLV